LKEKNQKLSDKLKKIVWFIIFYLKYEFKIKTGRQLIDKPENRMINQKNRLIFVPPPPPILNFVSKADRFFWFLRFSSKPVRIGFQTAVDMVDIVNLAPTRFGIFYGQKVLCLV
jgi:hypothetical protein